jgi:hypothetical protein
MTEYKGVVLGLDETVYHAHPALSSTGARKLLTAPREFQWYQQNPEPHKAAFDIGTAAHSKVLGVGAGTVVIPADKLASNGAASTNAAKEFIADAYAQGLTPVKQEVADEVDAMAEAILRNPEAKKLLEQAGDVEASVFATDPETGIELRARFDFLPNFMQDNPWALDLKSSGKRADSESFSKTVAQLGYDVQQEHYLYTLACAIGDASMRMKFIVVESSAPYLVAVHELSFEFGEIGAARARKARELFAHWKDRTDIWDGYESDPLPLQPPLWHIYQNSELLQ